MTATEVTAQATITGASALFVSLLGVEPQTFVWALVGSVLGVTLAKPSGRIYAIALFFAATLTCALLGTAAGTAIAPGSTVLRNSMTVLIGAGFHPALAAFFASVPGLVEWVKGVIQRRIGGQ